MQLHREYIKKYRKNTIAILSSMIMTIALVVCLLIVTYTDNHIKSLQYQYIDGAYDIAFKDLTVDQIQEISSNSRLEHVGLRKYLLSGVGNENQVFAIIAADKDSVLERTRILKGRMPEGKNEVIAEAWCLQNLGVKPEPNTVFKVRVTDPNNSKEGAKLVTYKVVGIISDNAKNKTYGWMELYTNFQDDYEHSELYLKYKSGINIEKEGRDIKNRYQLKSKQIHYNYAVLDYKYLQSQLGITDFFMILILLCVCMVVIAGVYRTSLMNRSSQYGILKAIGMSKRQLRKLIAAELYEIYLISIPIGVFLGFLVAYLISRLTRDRTLDLVFWGNKYEVHLIIPIKEIMVCIVGVGLIVGSIVIITSQLINRRTAVDIIRGELSTNNNKKYAFMTKVFDKSEKPYRAIALKYIFYDIKSTLFVVFSLSIGACVFIGLFYQAGINRIINKSEKQMYFYNGDFKLEKIDDDLLTSGLSYKVLENIQRMKGLKEVNTQRALPIRVLDDKEIARNQAYFDFFNDSAANAFSFHRYDGNDGTDQFYITELKAYNVSALKKLHKYILEGDYKPDHMQEDSVIIFMPKTIAEDDWRRPQNYLKSGYYVMDYKVGDELTFKYRTDLKTNTKEYYLFSDKEADYTYKKLKIAAIVYYPYMNQVSYMANAYPTLIISDEQMKQISPQEAYATITLSVDKTLGDDYLKDVNDRLLQLAIDNQGATARSIIELTRNMDNLYHKQLIYSYGIAFVVLLLAFINIINNLNYRVYIRKKDIGMYRAIGVKQNMICSMVRMENMILGGLSCVITCLASFPITGVLYKKSKLGYFQYGYQNDFLILAVMCFLILIICNIVSRVITKKLRGSSIVNSINSVE